MATYIKDVKIEADPFRHDSYRIEYKDKAVIVEGYHFNLWYKTLNEHQIYNFLIEQFFYEKSNMMYDEYFGSDPYNYSPAVSMTDKLKKQKVEQFEREILGNSVSDTPKHKNIIELKNNFWGMLIVEDVINDC